MIFVIAAVVATSILLAPMGCVLLWQRYNYFSDGLAHACLFSGIVSYFLNLPQLASMMVVSIIFAIMVYIFKFFSNKNTVISIVSSSMVALAIIFASKMPGASILETMLFGDIFSFTKQDLYIVLGMDILVLILLAKYLQNLVLISLNLDLARVQKIPVNMMELAILLILAIAVTLTVKNVGALLITALLVIPPATARMVSTTPLNMVIYSMIISLVCSVTGMIISFKFDLPLAAAVAIISVALYISVASVMYVFRHSSR